DFVVRAAAMALRQHPFLNAVLERDEIRLLGDVHIGVATALDDGLVVPVVRFADQLKLADIAAESARLAKNVRSGSFSAEDVSGSTFTVTSLGGQGVDAFTPILNPPEVAILGVGRIAEKAVRHGNGVGWRQEMTLSLTIDHCVIDGSPGAEFLGTVCELLAWPPALE
ncbi:MAG: 2-oxo acid dehydrogenase subunit E2, partial [Acidimicrobiales bacterium]